MACSLQTFVIGPKVSKRQGRHSHLQLLKNQGAGFPYVKESLQSMMLDIPYENVMNFDEMNLDFSAEGGQTLNAKGAKTVGVKGGQSSDRATAFIGVSMMGECFTLYIIYKGMENKKTGQIWREFKSPNFSYPAEMEYAMQKTAWMDET